MNSTYSSRTSATLRLYPKIKQKSINQFNVDYDKEEK